MTWLETPPRLQFVDWGDQYEPYAISSEEQPELLQRLPPSHQDGVVQGQHKLRRTGGLKAPMELGSEGAGAVDLGIHPVSG